MIGISERPTCTEAVRKCVITVLKLLMWLVPRDLTVFDRLVLVENGLFDR